jgi:hypothetical protein
MVEHQPFYHPLNRDTQSVRLIEILPGDDENASISCKFHVFDLNDFPGYTALSYERGPKTPTTGIFVDGQLPIIRENLSLALKAIQKRIKDPKPGTQDWRLMCINAICINQDDVPERNYQVNLMSKIYSQAVLVLVWLGRAIWK